MLYSKEDIKKIDQLAFSKASENKIINDVGLSLFKWFRKNIKKSSTILVLIGPGNNGKDGQALYRQLKKNGYHVSLSKPIEEAEVIWQNFDVIVDAVFGISINRNLPDSCQQLFKQISQSDKLCIALDMPSGLDPNDGHLWGHNVFEADITLTIGGYKIGQYLLPGRVACGNIIRIKVPTLQKSFQTKSPTAYFLEFNREWIKELRPTIYDNKYSRGKVSFVLSSEMPGAALMAARAAQAIGAGYVQVFCPTSMKAEVAIQYPSLVVKSYNDFGDITQTLLADEKCKTICLGPGFREVPNELSLFCQKTQATLIVDGGFLQKDLISHLVARKNCILTPHAGELARLSQGTTKWDQVQGLLQTFDGVVLAKGYDTIIAQKSEELLISSSNSPFLAKAGTGDILAGLISGLSAQGFSPLEACRCAVYLHCLIAKKLRFRLGPESMLRAIGAALNHIDSLNRDVL